MTYRDDTALEEACDTLETGVAELRRQLIGLEKRGEELDRDINRARKHLILYRIKQWIRRHPKSIAALLLILLTVGWIVFKESRDAQQRRDERSATLGTGCKTRLLLFASHPRATAYVNEVKLGTVPLDVRICPGNYRLRLVHDRTFPWQVSLRVGSQAQIEYHTQLAPRDSLAVSSGTLFFSQPPGALLFVDGVEAGWTPVFVQEPASGKARLRLGLWRPGYRPGVWHLEPKPSHWLHLGPLPPEAAP